MTFSEEIKQEAYNLGFDACGIAPAVMSSRKEHYLQWIANNYHAGMSYMERNIDKRLDPRLLVDAAKSIISVALNYYPPELQPPEAPQFAYYAYGKDYHNLIKDRLSELLSFIQRYRPNVGGRYFVDSAPLLERYWAAESGIGFIGKNSLLIIPGKGSYFFLGELIIDIELDYDSPISNHCGSCRRCIDACPTDAIDSPYRVNANRCISYHTIENRGEIPEDIVPRLNNYLFGCDICQKVCPWNHSPTPHNRPELMASADFLSLDLAGLLAMDENRYRKLFGGTAVSRAKFSGLKRNLAAISKTDNK